MQIRHGASCNEPQSTRLTLLPLSATKRRQLSVTTTAAGAAAATVPVQHVFASTVAQSVSCCGTCLHFERKRSSSKSNFNSNCDSISRHRRRSLTRQGTEQPSRELSLSLSHSHSTFQLWQSSCRSSPEAPKKHASQPQQCCFLCVYFAAFFFSLPPLSLSIPPSLPLFSSAFVYLLHFKCSQRCVSSSSSQ